MPLEALMTEALTYLQGVLLSTTLGNGQRLQAAEAILAYAAAMHAGPGRIHGTDVHFLNNGPWMASLPELDTPDR